MIKISWPVKSLCAAFVGGSMMAADIGAVAAPSEMPMIPLGGVASMPVGHYYFCNDLPSQCNDRTRDAAPVVMTQENWDQLVSVNNFVNTEVHPMTDEKIFGQQEFWSFPIVKDGVFVGDCEDYALQKRYELINLGWPASSLILAMVQRRNGEGHAVLLALTDRGTFSLDNLDGMIRRWDQIADYTFLKAVDPYNSGQWRTVLPYKAQPALQPNS